MRKVEKRKKENEWYSFRKLMKRSENTLSGRKVKYAEMEEGEY
jgi:hypothetical protein